MYHFLTSLPPVGRYLYTRKSIDSLYLKIAGALFFLLPNLIYGQDQCVAPVTCDELKVEMIRIDNASSTCGSGLCDADLFRQRTFKAYLIFTPATPPTQALIALDYQQLNVKTTLKANPSQPNGVIYSKINETATLKCFGSSHEYWALFPISGGDKVIFNADSLTKEVSIDFFADPYSSAPCGANSGSSGNKLIFNFSEAPPVGGSPSGLPGVLSSNCMAQSPALGRCAYLELFTIVVDAYPGETMSLTSPELFYKSNSAVIPPDQPLVCTSPSSFSYENGGNFNAISTGSPFPIITPAPVSFSNTQNANITVELSSPINISTGVQEVSIQLKNTSNIEITPKYVEFVIQAQTLNLNGELIYFGAEPFESVIYSSGTGLTKNLHYKIVPPSGSVVPANGILKLCAIRMGPAAVQNLKWSVTLSFDNSAETNNYRLKTLESVCTNLKSQSGQIMIEEGTDLYCTNTDIHFTSEILQNTCGAYTLRLGLKNTNPSAQYRIAGLNFKAVLNMPSTVQLVSPNSFPNWGNFPTNDLSCGSTCGGSNYCVSSNNIFQYCFLATQPQDAKSFSPSAFNYIDIPVSFPGNECVNSISIQNISINLLDIVAGQPVILTGCVPVVDPSVGFPICPSGNISSSTISGKLETNHFEGIENATISYTHDCNNSCEMLSELSEVTGVFGKCRICYGCDKYTVTPTMELDPLNGVNTWDLVLISRNILGLEPLSTPYKLISADANKSGTVTTFDIVEIRKLILGTYTELPNNDSWRFVDKTQIFANPLNPFAETIIEKIVINAASLPANTIDFIGCKIGDVDLTAVPNMRPVSRPSTTINWTTPAAKNGDVITIPVAYTGTDPLNGLQFAMRFDPAKWHFIAPSAGTVQGLSADNFGTSQAGEGIIRFSWNVMGLEIPAVQPDDVLFYLTFKVIENSTENAASLALDYGAMPEGAWKSDGTEYELHTNQETQQRSDEKQTDQLSPITVTPNPTSGSSILSFHSEKTGKTRLVLADAFGNQITLRDIATSSGKQEILLSELEKQPAGVYIWWIRMPDRTIAQGRVVKQ